MIKKLKIGLLATVLAFGFVALPALAADLTYTDNSSVTINSRTYVIQAGSTATSMVVGSTTLTVTVPAASTFILISNNRDSLVNNVNLTQSCNNSQSSVTVTGAATVIFTPTSSTCSFGASGGLVTNPPASGQTTSTVAQSSTPVTLTVTPATPTTAAVTETTMSPGCSGGNMYNTSTGALCVNNSTNTNANANASGHGPYNLGTKTLKNGSKGEEVKELQRLLNQVLSLGLVVDGKLGPKTIAVIKKWQKDHGLVADGLIGAKTKAKMKTEAE